MTPDVNTVLVNLPAAVAGYTISNADTSFTIFLNARLSHERLLKAYEHELFHINNGDYEKKCSIDLLECYAHANR